MEAKYPEITLGEPICSKLKDIYFSEEKWPDCHRKVADKFTVFKRILRNIYPDKDNVEILKSVQRFDTLDIQEVFSMEEDYPEDVKGVKDMPKYDKKVTWVPVPIEQIDKLETIRKMLV